jgi:hypothetical protein
MPWFCAAGAAELVNTGRFFENTQNTVRVLAHAKYIGNTSGSGEGRT